MGRQAQIKKARRICNQLRAIKKPQFDIDRAAYVALIRVKGGVRDRINLKIAGVR